MILLWNEVDGGREATEGVYGGEAVEDILIDHRFGTEGSMHQSAGDTALLPWRAGQGRAGRDEGNDAKNPGRTSRGKEPEGWHTPHMNEATIRKMLHTGYTHCVQAPLT